jgi:ribosomal protein L37AE/L43A
MENTNLQKPIFINCEKCGRRLIQRLPNGMWRFVFGKSFYYDVIGYLKQQNLSFEELQHNDLIKTDCPVCGNEKSIKMHKRGGYFICESCSFSGNFLKFVGKQRNAPYEIIRALTDKFRIARSDSAPVEIFIHGSLKIKCFRSKCGHFNVLTYFPMNNQMMSEKSPDTENDDF